MTPQQFLQKIKKQSNQIKRYIQRDAPRIVATEAVNHFKKSFLDGGFTDSYLVPWKPSKRTNPSSIWYGFEYGARTPTPSNHPRRTSRHVKTHGRASPAGRVSKYKPRKSNPITNYSPAATKRRTMSGKTGDLKDSIQYRLEPSKAIIFSDQPYAAIHNEGGKTSVFGRKTVTMPKRQFIGDSIKLNARIKYELQKDITRLLT